jgi:hypothetical protein
MSPEPNVPLQDRAVLTAARRKPLELQARKALLSASEDLTLCSLVALARLRDQPDAKAALLAGLRETEMRWREAEDRAQILAERLDRIEPRCRPHYCPETRFRILCHMRTYLLSVEEAAHLPNHSPGPLQLARRLPPPPRDPQGWARCSSPLPRSAATPTWSAPSLDG